MGNYFYLALFCLVYTGKMACSIYTFFNCHDLILVADTSEEAWDKYLEYNYIPDLVNHLLTLAALLFIYDFIFKLKLFWDLIYFDKISYVYNTKFCFNDQGNKDIQK